MKLHNFSYSVTFPLAALCRGAATSSLCTELELEAPPSCSGEHSGEPESAQWQPEGGAVVASPRPPYFQPSSAVNHDISSRRKRIKNKMIRKRTN